MAEGKGRSAQTAGQNGKRVLGPKDVKRSREIKEIEFPGYDGVFRIQKVGWRELEEVQLAAIVNITQPDGTTIVQNNRRMYIPRMVAAGWVDEKGERYLKTIGEAEELADSDVQFMNLMYEAISDFNNFNDEAREEAGKDSKPALTVSGGSSSAPIH